MKTKIGVVCGSFHKDEVNRMLDTVKSTIEDQSLLGSWGVVDGARVGSRSLRSPLGHEASFGRRLRWCRDLGHH